MICSLDVKELPDGNYVENRNFFFETVSDLFFQFGVKPFLGEEASSHLRSFDHDIFKFIIGRSKVC